MEKRKVNKKRWKIENGRRESYKVTIGPCFVCVFSIIIIIIFFFLFIYLLFFFFCFSLFKSTEICFGSTTMGIFTGKKIRKNDFTPSEKYSSYAPVCTHVFSKFLLL